MSETDQCSRDVATSGLRMHYHPCLRKATITRNGKRYCYQHDPEAVAARQKKLHAKWQAEWDADEKKWRRGQAAFKALALLEKILTGADVGLPVLPLAWERKAKRIVKEANT